MGCPRNDENCDSSIEGILVELKPIYIRLLQN